MLLDLLLDPLDVYLHLGAHHLALHQVLPLVMRHGRAAPL